jgi:CSLREA domain-containing protein
MKRVFAVLILVWALTFSLPAATFTVNSTADASDATPGNGICATSSGGCTLRAAIEETNALAGADTIALPAGTYVGRLTITGDLTLSGAGSESTVISGLSNSSGSPCFSLNLPGPGTNVSISGVSIQDIDVGSSCSAVLIAPGVTAVLDNVAVRNNRFYSGRAGIANGGTLTLNHCLVSNNHGGAGSGGSGGAISNGGAITINDSIFADNFLSCGHSCGSGGAIHAKSEARSPTEGS